jgi:CubicO group peptidase (beta-lactamase class C family)
MSGEAFATLDDAIRGACVKWGVPGMTIGILKDGEMSLHAYGVLNRRTGAPVAAGSLFQIGSITKTFTATLIMKLAEEGKLKLSDPVSKHLPELRLKPDGLVDQLTILHLLNHMSGLFGDYFVDHGNGDDALSKAMVAIAELEPITPPDFAHSYCNLAFNIIGAVIEAITGTSYEQAMADGLFAPLKLDPITFYAHEAILYSVAVGHSAGNPAEIAEPFAIPRASNAAGAIMTNVENLLKYAQFHLGDGTVDGEAYLTSASVQAMQEVTATVRGDAQWGIGFAIDKVDGAKMVGHGGATNGQHANLKMFPEHGYAIAALTNGARGSAAYNEVIKWALKHDLGLDAKDPEAITPDDAWLARRLGTFAAALTELTIKRNGDGFTLETVAVNPFNNEKAPPVSHEITPIEDGFFISGGPMRGNVIDFVQGAAGDSDPFPYARLSRLAKRV